MNLKNILLLVMSASSSLHAKVSIIERKLQNSKNPADNTSRVESMQNILLNNSYILLTPPGINQALNLTAEEQQRTIFTLLLASSDLNYVHVDADDLIADKLIGDKYINRNLPSLRDGSVNNQIFCRVKIDGYIVFTIGALKNHAVISAATAVGITKPLQSNNPHMYAINRDVISIQNSPVKLYLITNPAFFSSEVLVYSYDGNIGIYAAQGAMESFDVVKAFSEVLKLASMRKNMKASIVYTGGLSDALILKLIHSVNLTTPVFLNLDDSLEYIKKDFFHTKLPHLRLDEHGCPIGQQSKIEKITLNSFMCTSKFSIGGLGVSAKDYGLSFAVQKSNRQFTLEISSLSKDGTISGFNMIFSKRGLVVQANGNSSDVISSVGLENADRSITFDYKGFINSKEYEIKISSEESKFGVGTNAAQVDVRKNGKEFFKTIGLFVVHGQPKFARFCGFSPNDSKHSYKAARTEIRNVESQYINCGLSNMTNHL